MFQTQLRTRALGTISTWAGSERALRHTVAKREASLHAHDRNGRTVRRARAVCSHTSDERVQNAGRESPLQTVGTHARKTRHPQTQHLEETTERVAKKQGQWR